MTASSNAAAEDRQPAGRTLSLWNLHEDLAKLADELAAVAKRSDATARNDNVVVEADEPGTPRGYFSALLEQHRARERFFGDAFFSEPAWDVMLQLMIARIDGREIRISELGSTAPSGIVTRLHIDTLIDAKLVDSFDNTENHNDPFLALSSEAARRMAELYRARMRG